MTGLFGKTASPLAPIDSFGPRGTRVRDYRFDRNSRDIASGLTYARSGTATTTDYLGATVTAPANQLRIAGARYVQQHLTNTNLLAWSKDGTFAVSDASGVAPDGTNTAVRVTFTAASQSLFLSTSVIEQPRTASVWVKPVLDADAGKTLRFDHGGNTVHTLTAGWQQISRTATTTTTSPFSIGTYSAATVRDILVWRPSLTLGTAPTNYVPRGDGGTTPFSGLFVDGAASFSDDPLGAPLATVRGAVLGDTDNLILPLSAAWFNEREGYVTATFTLDSPTAPSDTCSIITLDDGTISNRILLYADTATQTLRARADIAGVDGSTIIVPLGLAGRQTTMIGWSDSGLWLSAGSSAQAFADVPLPSAISRILIGRSGPTGLKGAVSRVSVYG